MEKTMTINGKMVVAGASGDCSTPQGTLDRRGHLKVWRQIYQDVRRQWAEAEHSRPRRSRYIR